MSRSRKEKSVPPESYRQFSKLYHTYLRFVLTRCAAAYCWVHLPPFAYVNDQPAVARMATDENGAEWRGMWLESRIGSVDDIRIAHRARELAGMFDMLASRNGSRATLDPVGYQVLVRSPINDEARYALWGERADESSDTSGDVRVSCCIHAAHYSPVRFLYRSGVTDGGVNILAHHGRDDTELLDPDWIEWLSGLVIRRHEAYEALCFLQMVANNGMVSTATVMRLFPWLRTVANTLGVVPEHIMHEALLPWRGHNGDLSEYMQDIAPNTTPAALAAAPFPWTRFGIEKWLVDFGQTYVSATLAKMVAAAHVISPVMPNKPFDTVRVSLPFTSRGVTGMGRIAWLSRYAGAVAGDGTEHDLGGASGYRSIMGDIAGAALRL